MSKTHASLAATAVAVATALCGPQAALAQNAAGAARPAGSAPPAAAAGTVEHINVYSPSIAGNLHGNPADRDVLVYLPPSYGESVNRRYPVVYQLHGWLPGAEQWSGMISFKDGTDRAIASGAAREMIVVVPDSLTVIGGSMYSSSVTSGDFERWIAHDLVEAIDARYRTIATRESRGLSGHSMGGYGTLRIAMKHPERYSSIYAMSSCCVGPYSVDNGVRQAAAVTTLEGAISAQMGAKISLTIAAAWSPNPAKPPIYMDFPVTESGETDPLILAKWNANVPLTMLDQYVHSFESFEAIGLEVGTQDGLMAVNKQFSDALTAYGIEHTYETYEGNHTNKVAERYETRVLPFFSKLLEFE
jgi:enterochelin esterase-like enzyme